MTTLTAFPIARERNTNGTVATRYKLADNGPPIEPPKQSLVGYAKAHDVVVWRHDATVSKTRYATKEAAVLAYNAVSYAIAYKAAVYDGREPVAIRTLSPPTNQSELDRLTLAAWQGR